MAQRSITSFFSGAAVTVSRKRSLAEVAEPGDEIDELADSQLMHTPCETRAVEMGVSESPAPDISHIVKLGMSVENISAAVAGLSRGKKYELLFRHVSPPNRSTSNIFSWLQP